MENNITSLTAMSIARMPFLSARERIRLFESLNGNDIHALTLGDVERIVNRRISSSKKTVSWDAAAWETAAKRDVEYLQAQGAFSCCYFDEVYPPVLRETARPPFVLYYKGALPASDIPSLAIVGTRYPSGRGIETAHEFAFSAAALGIPVVSGLARGIDTAAHKGALAASDAAPTFAVLGRGIDGVYPMGNKALAASIIASGGGLISEYPPGKNPTRWTFPERNRILAGLCRATLVVEAPARSGALISAAFALEEGRDVYVAAAVAGTARAAGSDALANDGAKAVQAVTDIIEDWGIAVSPAPQIHTSMRSVK